MFGQWREVILKANVTVKSRVRERRTHGSMRGLRREPLVCSTDGKRIGIIIEDFVLKREYSVLLESMSGMEMYGFHWMEFVVQISSPLYIITSYKNNGLTNPP